MNTQPADIQTRNERIFNFTASTKAFGDVPVMVRVFEKQIFAPKHGTGWTWIWESESHATIEGQEVPFEFDRYNTEFVRSTQVPGYEGERVAMRCDTSEAERYMFKITRERQRAHAKADAEWRRGEWEHDNF